MRRRTGRQNQSGRMLEEQIDFNRAVDSVLEWTNEKSNWDETLLIVTADHECGYLTGPDSGDTDKGTLWNEIKNNGRRKPPAMQWNSPSHTNSLVPFYAKGKDAELFKESAVGTDPIR